MTREEMIATVNGEIGRLEQILVLLKDSHSERFTMQAEAAAPEGGGRTRVLSPEARKRIAQAQKRRWAEQKKREGGVEAK
jgi:hypothetical protein